MVCITNLCVYWAHTQVAEKHSGLLQEENDTALWQLMQSNQPIHTLLVCYLIAQMMKSAQLRYNNGDYKGVLISLLNT